MSLSSVLTMGFQPSGNINLVTTMGYGQGGTVTPPPTPPSPDVQSFFGGGPFLKRYGYDPKYYGQKDDLYQEAKELRDELPGPVAEHVEEAIFRAVEAVTEDKPKQFFDAQKVYDRVFASVRTELRRDLWRAEIERRISEDEEDQLDLMLIEALS